MLQRVLGKIVIVCCQQKGETEELRHSLVQGFVQGDSELRSSGKSLDSDMDVLLSNMLLSSCFGWLHGSGVLQDPQREEPNGSRCLLHYPSPESFLLRR